jgi:hypothetical protein
MAPRTDQVYKSRSEDKENPMYIGIGTVVLIVVIVLVVLMLRRRV